MDFSIWVAFLGQVALLAVATSAILSVVLGMAIASFGRFSLWAGALVALLVPIVGPIVLLIVAIVRASSQVVTTQLERRRNAATEDVAIGPSDAVTPSPRRWRGLRLLSRAGLLAVLALALLAAAAASTLFLQWFVIDLVVVPQIPLSPWGTGLDVALILSVMLLAVALLLAAIRASRVAAVLVAGIGSAWTFVGGVGMLLIRPVQETLASAESTFSDVLGGFGPVITSTVASVLGSEYEQVSTIRLVYVGELPTISFGPAPLVVLLVGVASLVWATREVFAAHRRTRLAKVRA